jgi:carbon monoxide dehydrogenase subunit G
MVCVSTTERVAAAPEEVFAFLDTPANHERISPSISSVHGVTPLDDGGHRAGYTYQLFGIPLRGTVEAAVHDPPTRLQFSLDGGIDGLMDWRIESDGSGTTVTCEATFEVPGGPLAALFAPLVRWYNQRELDGTLANLRAAFEETDTLDAGT